MLKARRTLLLADLDFRNNAIGFLRFLFASIVVWSHAFGLGGFGFDPLNRINRDAPSAGLLAVGGFFVLSGFLIARSYESVGRPGRFLWHRFLRIFPGFWVCLAVTALGFAPLAYAHEHGTLRGFLAAVPAAWSYVASNSLLTIGQSGIGGLLAHVPYPFVLNSSLWTLQYEFFCYLCLALFGMLAILKRAPALLASLAAGVFILCAWVVWQRGGHGMPSILGPLGLFVYFALGAYAYALRDRIPMRTLPAAVCCLALVAFFPTRLFVLVAIPCIAYLTLFAAMRLPIRSFDRRIDLSYGIYIYAFPVQQLLALYALNAWGFIPYFAAALGLAALLAVVSWTCIERPSLALKNKSLLPALVYQR